MIDLDSIGPIEERRSLDLLKEGVNPQVAKPEENFHAVLSYNATHAEEAASEVDPGIDPEAIDPEVDPTAHSMVSDERDTEEMQTTDDDGIEASVKETAEETEGERLRREDAARPAQDPRAPARRSAREHLGDRAGVKDLNAHHPLVSSLMVHGAKGAPGGAVKPEAMAAASLGGERFAAAQKKGNPGSLELRQSALRTAGVEGGAEQGVRDKGADAAGAAEKRPIHGAAARGRSSREAQRRDSGADFRAPQEAPKEVTPSFEKNAAHPVEGQGGRGEATPTTGRALNGGMEFGGLSSRSMTSAASSSHAAQSSGEAPSAAQLADRVRLADFSAGLERFVLKGTSKVQMRLDPPELGMVDIEIEVKDGEVFLSVRAESVEAVSALRSEMESLGESLKEQGLDLSHFELEHSDLNSGDSGEDPASSSAQGNAERSRQQADAEAASTTIRGITADGRLDVMV